jgi:tetratricopeptide (TPR) repeat protein
MEMPEPIGTLLNGRYQLEAELGRGGMGVVYRAHDTLLDRPVAVKVLSAAALGTEGRAHLLREARAAAGLNHPNIVTVYDVGEADAAGPAGPMPFIVMELVEGPSLHDRRPDSLEETVAVARQVCAALEHAHTHGIVHRDLKPENVLLTADPLAGTGPVAGASARAGASAAAKLSDFGLARSMASRLTAEGAIAGTVFYLAPELALGQPYDGRADLYALGVMLYELTTGRLPFLADDPLAVITQHLHSPVVPPRARNADIPPALDALIVRLLSKDPEDRPASAAEVLRALEAPDILDREALPARELSVLERIERGRLAGREAELAQTRALWQKVVGGEGQTLLISGEPGIGKTRLVREVATQVRVAGGRVLEGECYHEGIGPYAPFAQILRRAFEGVEADGYGLPDFVLADLLILSPALRLRYPDLPPNPPLDPKAEQLRLFENVVAFCAALSERAPLLLVLEDAHWADGGTLSLLRHLARRTRRQRVMIVATYREVELDAAHPFHEVLLDLDRRNLATRLKLFRLGREGTHDMLAALFAEETGPDQVRLELLRSDFLDGIYRETEGNPFFVEEVCRALVESGQLTFEGGRWHRPGIEELGIPQSVRLAIQSRLGRLPLQAQDALCLAAIVGREFDFDTLAQASELEEDSLVDALERAERAQLIGELSGQAGGTFSFTHGLIPATLIEGLSGLRRRRLHRRVAGAIEASPPDDGTHLAALAYHYSQAGVEDKALHYLAQAGDQARASYANQDAIRYYSQALEYLPGDAPQRFDLLAARASVYDLLAQRVAQLADVEAMLQLAEVLDSDTQRFESLIALADYYLATLFIEARVPAEKALAIAQKLDDPVREGHALRRLGVEAQMRWASALSRKLLGAAGARFREAGQPAETATCLHLLSVSLGRLGDYAAARQAAEEAVDLSRAAGDKRQEAGSLSSVGMALLQQARYSEALTAAQAALTLHRELGDRGAECRALNTLGNILSNLGKPGQAEPCYRESLEIAEAIGLTEMHGFVVNNMILYLFRPPGEYEAGLDFVTERLEKALSGEDHVLINRLRYARQALLTALGQYAVALEEVRSATPLVDRVMGLQPRALIRAQAGRLHACLAQGELAREILAEALRLTEEATEAFPAHDVLRHGAGASLLLGEQADLRQGLAHADRAVSGWRGAGHATDDLADALCTKARLHLGLLNAGVGGQHAVEALAASSELVELAETYLGAHEYERYYYAHSLALRANGHDNQADDYLQRAYERVMLVASKTQDERLRRSWLENVLDNREIVAEWEARHRP